MLSAEIVERVVRPAIEAERLELCEVKIGGSARSPLVMIVIDQREGNVTVGQCSAVNRMVHDILEIQRIASPNLSVEVSSPGIDRPLSEIWQFKKNIGRRMRLVKSDQTLDGRISAVTEEGEIVLLIDGDERRFNYRELSGAKIVIEMPARGGKPKRNRNEARNR